MPVANWIWILQILLHLCISSRRTIGGVSLNVFEVLGALIDAFRVHHINKVCLFRQNFQVNLVFMFQSAMSSLRHLAISWTCKREPTYRVHALIHSFRLGPLAESSRLKLLPIGPRPPSLTAAGIYLTGQMADIILITTCVSWNYSIFPSVKAQCRNHQTERPDLHKLTE